MLYGIYDVNKHETTINTNLFCWERYSGFHLTPKWIFVGLLQLIWQANTVFETNLTQRKFYAHFFFQFKYFIIYLQNTITSPENFLSVYQHLLQHFISSFLLRFFLHVWRASFPNYYTMYQNTQDRLAVCVSSVSSLKEINPYAFF